MAADGGWKCNGHCVTEKVGLYHHALHYKISDMSLHVSFANHFCITCSLRENKTVM